MGATPQGLGSEPTHFAVLKDFVFQQKLKPEYAKNALLFFEKNCKNRQVPQNNKSKCFTVVTLLCRLFYFTTLQFLLVVGATSSDPAPWCNCALYQPTKLQL